MSEELIPKLSMKLSSAGFDRFLREGGGVDFRLDEACWSSLEDGDVFEFLEDPGQARQCLVRIIKLYKANSFSDLIDNLPDTLFEQSQKDAYLDFFSQWWSRESEEREGALALHIEVINH